jgi:cob(I)alamin adenosyltransferase
MIDDTHRSLAACTCVHHRLVVALGMLDEAKANVQKATAVLEPDGQLNACLAVDLLTGAARLRSSAAAEIREALRAIEDPLHAVSTDRVEPEPAAQPRSRAMPAA